MSIVTDIYSIPVVVDDGLFAKISLPHAGRLWLRVAAVL